MKVLATSLSFSLYRHGLIKDFQQIVCQKVQVWILNNRADMQHHSSEDRAYFLRVSMRFSICYLHVAVL